MKSKKLKSKKTRKSKKIRKSRNNKQYGGNEECSIKVPRYDYKEEVNKYKDKNCDVFYYEDNNNFYKLRKRNNLNFFGKTRCTSNPPSGTLRQRCKNNRILQSDAFRKRIFERAQRASEKRSQQMPPMDPINEEREINLPRTSSYISPLTEKIEKKNDKIIMERLRRTSNRRKKPSMVTSTSLTGIKEGSLTAENKAREQLLLNNSI